MFTEFLVALQFLTIVRVKKDLPFDETTLGRAGVFFPVVGLALGGMLWGCDRGFSLFVPASVVNVFLVFTLAVCSRGFQTGGLVKSADGLCGSQERHHSLAMMQDGTLGTFGVLALIGVLVLKVRALDLLHEGYRSLALLLGPMLSRWAYVVMAYCSRPARTGELGAMLVRGTQFREFALASVFSLVIVFALVEILGLVIFVPVASVILAFTLYCHRRLGGVTGDSIGALGEIVETTVFCLFAILATSMAGR